jgi:hypothetical protein
LKRYVVMLAVMALLMVALAVPAFAAPQLPLPGQVERGPAHAKSICSFSGLNDFEEGPGPLTQSYGQEVKLGIFGEEGEGVDPSEVKSGPPSPGTFCNPQKAPPDFVGPFPEPVEE